MASTENHLIELLPRADRKRLLSICEPVDLLLTEAITQEFPAYMLGVRRVGVTKAAGQLQRSGLIRYHRGVMTVVDRAGLESAACSCYAADCKTYADLLG